MLTKYRDRMAFFHPLADRLMCIFVSSSSVDTFRDLLFHRRLYASRLYIYKYMWLDRDRLNVGNYREKK